MEKYVDSGSDCAVSLEVAACSEDLGCCVVVPTVAFPTVVGKIVVDCDPGKNEHTFVFSCCQIMEIQNSKQKVNLS